MKPIFKPVTEALGKGNKKYASIAIGAAVAAPVLFSNDDRGPIDTALVTTPLIGAAYVAGPRLGQTFQSIRRGADALRRNQGLFKGTATLDQIRNVAQSVDGKIFGSVIQSATDDALTKLYRSKIRGNKAINVPLYQKQVEMFLKDLPEANTVLAAHAMRRAQKRSYTLQQRWAAGVSMAVDPGTLTREQVLQLYAENKNNPLFLREMNRQLPKLRRFQKKVNLLSSAPVKLAFSETTKLADPLEFNLSNATQRTNFLNTMRDAGKEAVANELLKHKDSIHSQVRVVSERLASGGNRPLAVLLTKDGEKNPFRLYLQDDVTGTSKIGKRFNRVAAARHVHFGSREGFREMAPDLYIASNLDENWRNLRKEQLRLHVHHAADPDDVYDMIMRKDRLKNRLSPTAAYLRSRNIAASHLRLFVDESGDKTFWKNLSQSWRAQYFKGAARAGMITVVGSEGSHAAKGVVQMAELSLLDPLGRPRPDKQQATYRALSKSYELMEAVPESLRVNVSSTFLQNTVLGGKEVPGLKATVGGLTPGQREFFAAATAEVRDKVSHQAFRSEVDTWGKDLFKDVKNADKRFQLRRSEYKKVHGISGYKSWAKQRGEAVLSSEAVQRKLAGVVEKNILPEATDRVRNAGGAEGVAKYLTGLFTKDLQSSLRAGEALAAAGEGDTLLNADVFGGLHFMSKKDVEVDHLYRPDLEAHTIYDAEGKLKENWQSLLLGDDDLLGFYRDQAISGKGRGRIAVLGVERGENGAKLSLGYVMGLAESGTKINLGEQKGLALALKGEDFNTVVRMANEFSYQTGHGRTLAYDVNALSQQAYYNVKRSSNDDILGDLSEAARMMEEQFPGNEAVKDLKAKLASEHLPMDEHGRIKAVSEEIAAAGHQYSAARRDRAQRVLDLATEFYQKAEGHILNTYGAQISKQEAIYRVADSDIRRSAIPHRGVDAFVNYLEAHPEEAARMGKADSDVFARFLQYHHASTVIMPWDHSSQNVAKQATITYDQLAGMARMGQHQVIAELMGRAKFPDGDPFQFADFVEHLQGGDFSKPFGKHVESAPQRAFTGLKGMSRAGTMFDPTDPRFANGFSVQLDEALKVKVAGEERLMKYVPHAGWGAHGMHPNMFNDEQFSLTELERLFNNIWDQQGPDRAQAIEKYMESYTGLIVGKNSYRRSRIVDPKGTAGYIRTTYVKTENPFDVYLSEDMLQSLPAAEAKKLRDGGSVYAQVLRTPTSDVSLHQVRYNAEMAKNMGEAQIAYGEGVRIMKRSDDDLDRFVMSVLRDKDSIAEAERALAPGSLQYKMYRSMHAMRNVEDTSVWTAEYLREKQLKKSELSNAAKMLDLDQALHLYESRQAGSTVGHFSNFLTTLETALTDHPSLAHDDDFITMATPILWQTRQIPISAQKDAKGTITNPLEWLDRISKSWGNAVNSEQVAGNFVSEMSRFAKAADETSLLTQHVVDTFKLTRGYVDGKATDLVDAAGKVLPQLRNREINVSASLLDFHEEFQQKMKAFAQNRTLRSEAAAKAMTTAVGEGMDMRQALRMEREAGGVFKMLAEARPAAHKAAEMLGSYNKALAGAGKEVRSALGDAAPLLAAGLGVAAVAGAVFGGTGHHNRRRTAAPPPPASTRPERAAGETDHIPGEPVEGSAAPTSPRRMPARPANSVKTALVGQMRPSHNIEVRTRTTDHSANIESERSLENLVSSGGTYITKHYVGGWRQSSLRQRERMRNELHKRDQE